MWVWGGGGRSGSLMPVDLSEVVIAVMDVIAKSNAFLLDIRMTCTKIWAKKCHTTKHI